MRQLALITLLSAWTLTAFGQKNAKDHYIDSVQRLAAVTVKGTKGNNQQSINIGKMAIKAMDLPQSVAVIDRQIIEQQQATQLSDILKNINGVYQMGATGGVQEEIAARGFAFGSSNTFKNGIRFNNGIRPEITSLEKVEVLKGSSAILYGNVAAGGVLNLVTKKPVFEKGGEVSMRIGSYDFYKPAFDVYGAVDNSKHVAYRLNGTYEKSRSFRDVVNAERFYVNPSFLVKAGQKVEILVEGDYLNDKRTLDYGTGAVNYKIADAPRSTFLGATWSSNSTEQMSATATTTYNISKKWQLRNVTGVQNYNNELFGTTRPNASGNFVKDDGKWIRGVQRTKTDEQYYVTQLDLIGKFHTGAVKHNVLFGMDMDKYTTNTTAYNAIAKYDSVNIFDLNKYKQRSDIPATTENTRTSAPINRAGIYAQDLIKITKQIKALAGVRYTNQSTNSDVYYYKQDSTASVFNSDDAVTPRVGVVYQPIPTTSVFASYANSFVLNTGLDVNGKALPASFVDQYEVGVKNELFNGVLTANVTAYRIINHNLAQSVLDSTNPNARELAGEITSEGLEVDVMSRTFNGFTIIAGYSFNETKYTKSNTYEVGSLLRYNPNHTANASVYYSFSEKSPLRGFNLGLSGVYIGDRVAGRSTRLLIAGKEVKNDSYKLMPVPSYTSVDASIGYAYHNLSLRFKLSNLFNVLSYNVHDDNSVNPIAPRQFMTTLSYKF